MGAEWYEMQGIEVHDTDRGGRVTYHGPGQLVAYPIVSLKPYGDDVHEYVRRLERVAIAALAEHGVEAGTIEGLTGVWTAGETPGRQAGAPTRRARSARSASTSAAASPPTGWRSTSTTTCSRSSGSSPAGSRAAGSPRSAASWAPSRTSTPSPTPSPPASARSSSASRSPTEPAALGLDSARLGDRMEPETTRRRPPSASTSPAPAPSRAGPRPTATAPSPSAAPASRRG